MSVSVRIPTILRTYTDGASELSVEPAEDTVAVATPSPMFVASVPSEVTARSS